MNDLEMITMGCIGLNGMFQKDYKGIKYCGFTLSECTYRKVCLKHEEMEIILDKNGEQKLHYKCGLVKRYER
jgi:hypothetical protein